MSRTTGAHSATGRARSLGWLPVVLLLLLVALIALVVLVVINVSDDDQADASTPASAPAFVPSPFDAAA